MITYFKFNFALNTVSKHQIKDEFKKKFNHSVRLFGHHQKSLFKVRPELKFLKS